MGLDPVERGWFARHSAISTILVIVLIAVAFMGLKFVQEKYFPAEPKEFKTPVFLNYTFNDINQYFDLDSNLTSAEQEKLFEENYKYNVFKWTCKPISCQEIVGKPTLKLICTEYGFTEDVRIVMQGNCTDAARQMEVTVVFQLMSKTGGNYYLGRSGRIADE
jgi:hypothetical protein